METRPNAIANTDDFEFEALKEAANYRKVITQTFAPYLKGNVIEIGAGIGQMTSEFLNVPGIKRLLSVEPDPLFAQRHIQNLPGHELLQGIIQNVPPDPIWNAIVSINVLEHIQEDQAELMRYQSLLAPTGGHICLLVPARPEIYSPIDKDFGHYRRYKKPELRKALEQAGFQIVSLNYFNLTGYFAWWWSFKMLKARHFEVGQVRLFDQHIFPVTQWLERCLPSLPFGQSLIAIARA